MSVEVIMDFSKFSGKALSESIEILQSYQKYGCPDDMYEDGLQIMHNTESGMTFMTNSEYQVAVMENGKLESWYFTPYEGYEGTLDMLLEKVENNEIESVDDLEYIAEICDSLDLDGRGEWVRTFIKYFVPKE